MIIEEYQEPGKALADAMRRYGDKGSQALADSIYSSVQFGSAASPVPLGLRVVETTCSFSFCEIITNKH